VVTVLDEVAGSITTPNWVMLGVVGFIYNFIIKNIIIYVYSRDFVRAKTRHTRHQTLVKLKHRATVALRDLPKPRRQNTTQHQPATTTPTHHLLIKKAPVD